MLIKLKVPHVWQGGNEFWNDCSQASTAAAVCAVTSQCPSLAKVILDTNSGTGNFVSITSLRGFLRFYGVETLYTNKATLQWYKDNIRNGYVPIGLFDYRELKPYTGYNNDYAHFSPATGFDDEKQVMIISDTLSREVEIPYAAFERSINTPSKTLSGTNYPNQAIVTILKSEYDNMPVRGGANLDLYNALGHPDPNRLGLLTDMRIEINMSQIRENNTYGAIDIPATLNKYAPYMNSLKAAGKRVWTDLNHRFYGEGQPHIQWPNLYSNDAAYKAYIDEYVIQVDPLIAGISPYTDDYLLWNEGDVLPAFARASVPMKPHIYAYFVRKISAVIRKHDPAARIWIGEFATGSGEAIPYFQATGLALSEFHGFGLHPYDYNNIDPYLAHWRSVYPTKPIALTEFGVLGTREQIESLSPDFVYGKMLNVLTACHKYNVETAIYYAWVRSDNAYGLVGLDDQPFKTSTGKTIIDAVTSRVGSVPVTNVPFGTLLHEGTLEVIPNTSLVMRDDPNGVKIGYSVYTGRTIRVYSNKQVDPDGVYERTPIELFINNQWVKGWYASRKLTGTGLWRSRLKKVVITYIDL